MTVLFEDPFWIGVYERIDNNKYEVCKITFGAEPKDYEVYDFLLKNWNRLEFSPAIEVEKVEERKINPKRMQREISSQLKHKGIGTKAQIKQGTVLCSRKMILFLCCKSTGLNLFADTL